MAPMGWADGFASNTIKCQLLLYSSWTNVGFQHAPPGAAYSSIRCLSREFQLPTIIGGMKPHMDEIVKFHPPTYEHISLKIDGINPKSMIFLFFFLFLESF